MKKILIAILSMISSVTLAATSQSVMVNSNGIVVYPANFFATNGVQTTGSVVELTARVGALETVQVSESNSFNGRINSATNDIKVLQTNVAVISTNYTTLANGILGTSAYYRVGILETNKSFAQGINTTNTITALAFYGSGVGLTGVSASVTGAVSQISVGSSNMIGAITFNGTGVETTNNALVTVKQIAYIPLNIAPVTYSYEHTWCGPYDEDVTLSKLFAKCDGYTITFDIVTEATNAGWRTFTTNTAPIVVTPSALTYTNFIVSVIPSNTMFGVRVIDADPRATNLYVNMRIIY